MTRLETLENNMPRIRALAGNIYLSGAEIAEAARFTTEIPFLWGRLEDARAKINELESDNENTLNALDSHEGAHRDRFEAEDKLKLAQNLITQLEENADNFQIVGMQKAAIFVGEPGMYSDRYGRQPKGISAALVDYWKRMKAEMEAKRGNP